jgi:hypothetical protein
VFIFIIGSSSRFQSLDRLCCGAAGFESSIWMVGEFHECLAGRTARRKHHPAGAAIDLSALAKGASDRSLIAVWDFTYRNERSRVASNRVHTGGALP